MRRRGRAVVLALPAWHSLLGVLSCPGYTSTSVVTKNKTSRRPPTFLPHIRQRIRSLISLPGYSAAVGEESFEIEDSVASHIWADQSYRQGASTL